MATAEEEFRANFVVVGGGIAGVSCAEQVSYYSFYTTSITVYIIYIAVTIKPSLKHHHFDSF